MKKMTSIYLSAAATAIALVAVPAQAVVIDLNGAKGVSAASVFDVLTLDWKPDNALSLAALSTRTLGQGGPSAAGQLANESYIQTVAQGKLGSLGTADGDSFGLKGPGKNNYFYATKEITFQLSLYEFASGIGGATSSFRLAPGQNFLNIFADTNDNSNQILGTGYGDGTLIYSGVVTSNSGKFTDDSIRLHTADADLPLLDGFNGDDQHGVRTHVGQGSNFIFVKTNYLNNMFFLGDVNNIALSLTYSDTTNLNAPFISASPSNTLLTSPTNPVGYTPSYSNVNGSAINGGACTSGGLTEFGVPTAQCDYHFQSDASGSFNIPEPSSLALFGLALLGLSASVRRKKN